MIFKRKSKRGQRVEDEVTDIVEETVPQEADEPEDDGADSDQARWDDLDARDWRSEGPFDIAEVDLEADEVERLDFGALIVTPFDDMQMQLQIEQASGLVNSALLVHDQSALEVALFAAPSSGGFTTEIRNEIVASGEEEGHAVELAEGPFGTEIRREFEIAGPNQERLMHVSRTWLVEGPRWLLRGVLMGMAATEHGTGGATETLHDAFANLVVRRDDVARAPGDLIRLTVPEGMVSDDE